MMIGIRLVPGSLAVLAAAVSAVAFGDIDRVVVDKSARAMYLMSGQAL